MATLDTIMKPSKDILQALSVYEWVVDSKPRGLSGPQLGSGAGQSTEFLDHRLYVAGDDIRRIDWNAVARTDQVLIKRYQEEIRPSVVMLVDDSLSMSIYEDKVRLLYDGVAWIHQAIAHLEATTKVLTLERGPQALEQSLQGDWELTSSTPLGESCTRRLSAIPKGAHVIVLSDLLSPHEPDRLARALKQRAHRCTVIQILGQEDWFFEEGTLDIKDAETGEVVTISLDRQSIDAYHQRLAHIQSDWQRALQGWGEVLTLQSPQSWQQFTHELLRCGVLSVSA